MELTDIARKVEGVWLPRNEKHLLEWMTNSKGAHRENGRITYQWSKQVAAREVAEAHGKLGGLMVDVGAHVGLWSMWWGQWMKRIVAYEPIWIHRDIYRANMKEMGLENYELVPFGLSDTRGEISFRVDGENTGNTRAYAPNERHDAGTINSRVDTLDYEMHLRIPPGESLSVIKIDCEGMEELVLRGGAQTIRKHKPLIIVEQKQGARYYGYDQLGGVTYLKTEFGYTVAAKLSGDYVMVA